ncbi:MAG: hypothetical protein R6U04_08590 [Bacteroidales bacterium]
MKKHLLIVLLFILVTIQLFSQDYQKKHTLGLQTNIFLDEDLYEGHTMKAVWAFRYSYARNENLVIGPEISGYRLFVLSISDTKTEYFNFGGFGRYILFPDKRFNPFGELSLYCKRRHFVPSSRMVGENIEESVEYKLTGFIAPGISLKSKSRKFSFDLMYKFSPDDLINNKHSVLSYRVNFHF